MAIYRSIEPLLLAVNNRRLGNIELLNTGHKDTQIVLRMHSIEFSFPPEHQSPCQRRHM